MVGYGLMVERIDGGWVRIDGGWVWTDDGWVWTDGGKERVIVD